MLSVAPPNHCSEQKKCREISSTCKSSDRSYSSPTKGQFFHSSVIFLKEYDFFAAASCCIKPGACFSHNYSDSWRMQAMPVDRWRMQAMPVDGWRMQAMPVDGWRMQAMPVHYIGLTTAVRSYHARNLNGQNITSSQCKWWPIIMMSTDILSRWVELTQHSVQYRVSRLFTAVRVQQGKLAARPMALLQRCAQRSNNGTYLIFHLTRSPLAHFDP